jgi:FtsP/CotA-like multicopper oxidase with cupredoxin domain
MYHCATQPVLMHAGAGMVGMFVVKPKDLAPVDKELWMTQQEYYLGEPGKDADMGQDAGEEPDVIAFNGFANQYKDNPITVKRGERVRMYVLNAGPSIWSAFHVIGTVFDRTVVEGTVGHDAQTINLAPSQGGWVEFTLAEEGRLSVRHARLRRHGQGRPRGPDDANAPAGGGHGAPAAGHGDHAPVGDADVNVSMGDMWVKADETTVDAGRGDVRGQERGRHRCTAWRSP